MKPQTDHLYWSLTTFHQFHWMLLLILLHLISCSPILLCNRILGKRCSELPRYKHGHLVKQQHITKTTSIFWNTQSKKKKRQVLSFYRTLLFYLLSSFAPLLVSSASTDKRNKTTSHQSQNYHSFVKRKPWLKKHSQITAHSSYE
jgi:hypothetical protein